MARGWGVLRARAVSASLWCVSIPATGPVPSPPLIHGHPYLGATCEMIGAHQPAALYLLECPSIVTHQSQFFSTNSSLLSLGLVSALH